MTNEQLDCIDSLCAEKLMGMVKSSIVISDCIFHGYSEPGKEFQRLHTKWQPTRNISQAFELLKEFNVWDISFGTFPREDRVMAFVKDDVKMAKTEYVFAAIAAEAICLAVLKARGVKIE